MVVNVPKSAHAALLEHATVQERTLVSLNRFIIISWLRENLDYDPNLEEDDFPDLP